MMTAINKNLQDLVAVQFQNWYRLLQAFDETPVPKKDEEINDRVVYISLSVNLLLLLLLFTWMHSSLLKFIVSILDCPSALEIVGLRVPVRYIRDFPLFSVSSVSKNCASTRCASAANVICRDVDVFGPKIPVVETYIINCFLFLCF
jgi:hypothetical protein